jgi:hypothetical protein
MDAQLDSGRCAGPLASDLAAALPKSRPVSAARLRNGGRIDMRSRRAFAAGPFEGEVASTLVLRVRREIPTEVHAARRARSAALRRRYGLLTLTYAVERMSGEVGLGFAGTRAPSCGLFDVCDMTGDLAVRATDSRGTLVVHSARRLGSARRETAAGALSSLRAGRSRVDGLLFFGEEDSYPPVTAKFPVVETVGFPGLPPCSDDGTLTTETLNAGAVPNGLSVRLDPQSEDSAALRTRCPGPMAADLADRIVASGVVPYSAMGNDHPSLALRPPDSFDAPAFGGRGRGAIDVELKLTGVEVETQ